MKKPKKPIKFQVVCAQRPDEISGFFHLYAQEQDSIVFVHAVVHKDLLNVEEAVRDLRAVIADVYNEQLWNRLCSRYMAPWHKGTQTLVTSAAQIDELRLIHQNDRQKHITEISYKWINRNYDQELEAYHRDMVDYLAKKNSKQGA